MSCELRGRSSPNFWGFATVVGRLCHLTPSCLRAPCRAFPVKGFVGELPPPPRHRICFRLWLLSVSGMGALVYISG